MIFEEGKTLRRLQDFFDEKEIVVDGDRIIVDLTLYSVINKLVSELDPKTQCYLEVGTFTGTTLWSAAANNEAQCFAVDSFKMKCKGEDAEVTFKKNLERGQFTNVEYFRMPFGEFFVNEKLPLPVGLYFYDAAHDYKSTYNGIVDVRPFLCDEAIVMVHDTGASPGHPKDAVRDVLKKESEFEMIQEFESTAEWPCGVTFLKFTREESKEESND